MTRIVHPLVHVLAAHQGCRALLRSHDVQYEQHRDLSVFRDIARRWRDPDGDRLPDGRAPALITYDTGAGVLRGAPPDGQALDLAGIMAALERHWEAAV